MFHLRDEQIVNYRKLFSAMDADGGGSLVRLSLDAPCHVVCAVLFAACHAHVSNIRCVYTAAAAALRTCTARQPREPLSAQRAQRWAHIRRKLRAS
jgi:hypothetical protein